MLKNKKILFLLLIIFVLFISFSAHTLLKCKKMVYAPETKGCWVLLEPLYNDDFYKTKEAVRIGENLLFFQTSEGGWSKNINFNNKINFLDKLYLKHNKDFWQATIDNDATVTEIDYLSKLYESTKDKRYKFAAMRGIYYLLKLQYNNGGFPQITPVPLKRSYHYNITFNDNAMINVVQLLQKIKSNNKQYKFVDDFTRKEVAQAYNKGLRLILNLQLDSGMWAAQYDRVNLIPCSARAYEPISIDSRESASIVLFLMSIKHPSDEVVEAVNKSVRWFKKNKIVGKRLDVKKKNRKNKLNIVSCPKCDPMWIRLHNIKNGTPVFSDRSGVITENLSEIDKERMIHYDWYVTSGNEVLKEYSEWNNRMKK